MGLFKNKDGKTSIVKSVINIGTLLLIVVVLSNLPRLVETNDQGYYQTKQAFYTGEMTVRNSPGTYGQMLGTIETFKFSETINLSADDNDGGNGSDVQSVRILFPDGYANADVVVQYLIPADKEIQLELLQKYFTREGVKNMVRNQILEAFKNTGSLMNSSDAYADKRPDVIRYAQEQCLVGLYVPHVETKTVRVVGGGTRDVKSYSVKEDANGNPIISKPSTLAKYGITFDVFNVKDMTFDPKLTALIEQRKDAQKAEQAALTAKAEGDARIATEKATQEVDKIKQVTIAEKEKAVAILKAEKEFKMEELAALKAGETAKKIKAEGDAKAYAARALVSAGLTPLDRANIEMKTAIGVANALATVKFPTTMVIGGGDDGTGPLNPFDAVGLQSFIEISKGMATTTK